MTHLAVATQMRIKEHNMLLSKIIVMVECGNCWDSDKPRVLGKQE